MGNKCNVTVVVKNDKKVCEECGKEAVWAHPRWPEGIYCEEHKEELVNFFPRGWYKVKEDLNG
jgi:hypothetical protein